MMLMSAPFRVAIVGCGRMGEQYAQAYATYPDTEIVAIAEHDAARRRAVGERFGVTALYPDVHALLAEVVPDIVAVVTPTKFYKEAVIACAEAGVKGVSTDKPIAAVLADADEMVRTCQARGVVFAGGNLQRAMSEVQEAARRIRAGQYGPIVGASVHRWGGEISGGGCQNISVLRLLADAEVDEVIAWGTPAEALAGDTDQGLIIHGRFHLSNGLDCPVFGTETPYRGVEVWSEDALIRWDWGPPEIFQGYDAHGVRTRIEPHYAPYRWSEFGYLTSSIRSFLHAVETGSELWISGHDLRQALEVAIAAKVSAQRGSVPVRLPLEDRSLSLHPRASRWLGWDVANRPQSPDQAAGR
jgi:predicted dehydrogenase